MNVHGGAGGSSATADDVADEIIETLRRWVDEVVVPESSALELADEYPTAMAGQMEEFGLFGTTIPESHGGLDLDHVTYARVIEELSRGWMSLAGIVNSHLICAKLIDRFGTDEQRDRLTQMATGKLRGCFSLSEPDSGSDAGALRCRAVRDGDEFVINGTKMWVTNGERAGIVALLARVPEGDPSGRSGITCFLVDKTPGKHSGGITVSRKIDKIGYRGLETVEMSYVDHRVPADRVLGGDGHDGGIGNGLRWALAALELGRINVAARGVGVAQAAYDAALAYAKQREAFGKPIAKHQAIAFKIAEMATGEGKTLVAGMPLYGCGHGQAVRIGNRRRAVAGRHAHSRRERLLHRVPGGALLPGCAAHDHRRGHERDPETGHQPRPPGRRLTLLFRALRA